MFGRVFLGEVVVVVGAASVVVGGCCSLTVVVGAAGCSTCTGANVSVVDAMMVY